MKARTKYILFVIVIHLAMLTMAIVLAIETENALWLFVELLVLLSVVIAIQLYRALIRPVDLLTDGVESLKDQDFSTRFVPVGQPEMDQLIEVYNGMIDQLRKERIYQREQHFFLDRLVKASPSAVIVLDFEERISSLNPIAHELPGFNEETLGKKLSALQGILPQALSKLGNQESKIIRIQGVRIFKCQKSSFLDRGFQHHFIIVHEMTRDLLESERKAYEKVIRMMSHEVNNSTGGINSLLQSLLNYQEQLNENDRVLFSEALETAIVRNENLSRFMANFAQVVRIPLPNKSKTNLHELIPHTLQLLQSQAQIQKISLEAKMDKQALIIIADNYQLEQVLINIIKNAIEAAEMDSIVEIKTQASPPQICVSNSGSPISPEIADRLFTPFFSTKKQGQGIGLTLTKEILLNHGFAFSLESKEDGKTHFCIEFLPDKT